MPAKSPTGAFARAQAQGEAALRTALLDIAAGLLAAEGPAALSMRRLATAADCSTTVLYRQFGAKDAITAALYREGFARLRRRLDAVPRGDDPAEYLAALGRAYRANALEEPNFYGVMHGEAVPGFVPDEESRAAAAASLDVLREAARACVEAGVLRPDADVDEVTDLLWAAAHGVISLERGGHFPGALGEERFRALTRAAVAAFLP
ncbi:TetR/AcrR family transcriptional regulator [Kitasatospora aureofaciens]|uniref:TetR/AcrR family transcriptional regulator n=1 Tax=Kitasatospora aureofaciens TaxID=1894 RepID=UPI001C464126|nr:TetR/AcrR family transcriptional regulator [Kitasatospora aureofaciens]MBV6699812.1 TetR/AcrR family transcriptional regulator [Kitasatospora aureofaciens]